MHSNRFLPGQTAQINVISCFILQSALLWCSGTVVFIIFPLLRFYKNIYLSLWRFHSHCLLFVCHFDTRLCCPFLPFNFTLTLKFCQINTSLDFYLHIRCSFSLFSRTSKHQCSAWKHLHMFSTYWKWICRNIISRQEAWEYIFFILKYRYMRTVRNLSETIMEYIMVLFCFFLEVERKTKQRELCVVMETDLYKIRKTSFTIHLYVFIIL